MVAISPQRELYLKKMSEKLGLSFDLLRDDGNKVASQYGLTFTLRMNCESYMPDLVLICQK